MLWFLAKILWYCQFNNGARKLFSSKSDVVVLRRKIPAQDSDEHGNIQSWFQVKEATELQKYFLKQQFHQSKTGWRILLQFITYGLS